MSKALGLQQTTVRVLIHKLGRQEREPSQELLTYQLF